MKHLENYYRNLCEQLQQQLNILEAKMNEKKKKAKNKGKKNSNKEKMADKDYDGDGEVESSKDEYFGSKDKAIKKKMAEKKKMIKEGREIHGGIMNYGGFPRVIRENAVTQDFQDSPEQKQINVATKPNDQEVDLYVRGGMGLRYPSVDYARLGHEHDALGTSIFEAQKRRDQARVAAIGRQRAELLRQMEAHPDHAAFMATAERFQNDVRGGNYGE